MSANNFIPNPLRILHLEDDPADAELIQQRLVANNLNPLIVRAASHAEFSAALKEEQIDLILADIRLNGYNGFAALEHARKEAPGIPFIFLSGSLDDESATRAIQQGATDYVLKDDLARLG